MKNKKSVSRFRFLILFVCGVVFLFSLIYTISLIPNITAYFNDEVKLWASDDSLAFVKYTEEFISRKSDLVTSLASEYKNKTTEEMESSADNSRRASGLVTLQFMSGEYREFFCGEGTEISDTAEGEIHDVWEELALCIKQKQQGLTEIYTDTFVGAGDRCLAMYVPVENSSGAFDGIIASFFLKDILQVGDKDVNLGNSIYYCLAQNNGTIAWDVSTEAFSLPTGNPGLFSNLMLIASDTDEIEVVQKDAEKGLPGSYSLNLKNGDIVSEYIISTHPYEVGSSSCFVFSLYSKDLLMTGQFFMYEKILIAIYLLAAVIFVVLFSFFVSGIHNRRRIKKLEELDPELNCNSYVKFLTDAKELISVSKTRKSYMVYISLRNYGYLNQTYCKVACDKLLKHVCLSLKKCIMRGESFGHIHAENFIAVLQSSELAALGDRINVLSFVISSFVIEGAKGVKVQPAFGICEASEKMLDATELIEKASIANSQHLKDYSKPYVVYDSTLKEVYEQDAEVEAKMDTALKNEDFKLFYQPKYNLTAKKLDSAEVLVRWYDKTDGSYIKPYRYIGLFERNGFIVKLDYYIFETTCKFLRNSLQKGRKTVPLSVNVSRVTSMHEGFTEDYIKVKKQYGIPDGLITLEFTESFANERYDVLLVIVKTLQANGFKCSIDDFGVGSSAMNILKELPMDELKIDMSFLKLSSNPTKDNVILAGIIEIANKLGMKIVQEGVETIEELERVKNYGCEIIQGYYYSKPLHQNDFETFIINDNFIG